MRILIRIPVWKRYDLTEAIMDKTLSMVKSVQEEYGYSFIIQVLYSEEQYKQSPYFHHKMFYWQYTTNDELGFKLNQGLNHAMNKLDFDYMLEMGCDDLLHAGAWKIYKNAIDQQWHCFGFTDLEIREWVGPGLHYSRSSIVRYPQVIGAGRMFSRVCLEKASKYIYVKYKKTIIYPGNSYYQAGIRGETRYIPEYCYNEHVHELLNDKISYILWDPDVTQGNDITAERRVINAGYPIHELPGPYVIDYKTPDNLQKYDWLMDRIASYSL